MINNKDWNGVIGVRFDEFGVRAETKIKEKEYISDYFPTEEEARQSLKKICENPKGYIHKPYVLPESAKKVTVAQVQEETKVILTEEQLMRKALRLDD